MLKTKEQDRRITRWKIPSSEAPCRQACPAGIDVPRYVRFIKEGKLAEAAAVIREKTPFPLTLGHVCLRPCEQKCRRGEADEPVAINALKRFAIEQDTGLRKEPVEAPRRTGQQVGIIGSGPAGLTAAYYLGKLGHAVTVFEALPEPGGMMRVGIPEYRLPRRVLDSEIEDIKRIGVEIKTGARVESLDELFTQGYRAVLVAVGAHRGLKLQIPGENSPGVMDGVTFLREVNSGQKVNTGERVAVIGGGNVAMDAARAARRLGAKEVRIFYRRTRAQMLASAEEIRAGLDEGVKITFLAAPEKISRENGGLSLSCVRMRLGKPDASGRPRPMPVRGSGFSTVFDSIISAIGQAPDIPGQFGLKVGAGDTPRVSETLATEREGVFAAGDAVTGPASVIEAIGAGRRAAVSIDRYLGGKGIIDEVLAPPAETVAPDGFDEVILDKSRSPMPLLKKSKRLNSFAEVELGFGREAAVEEAARCLGCDRNILVVIDPGKCTGCHMCQLRCSLVYQGACNPEKARIVTGLPEIGWTEECIGGCALCIQHCPRGAIRLGQET